jgi:hypothetical protein
MQTQEVQPVLTTDRSLANCIDLERTFAGRFKCARDEAYVERADLRAAEAVWLTFIPCRFGKIHPYGGRILADSFAAGRARRRALDVLPQVTVICGGCPGSVDVAVTFDVADIEAVAAVLHARRPPRLSEAERARRHARLLELRARRAVTRAGSEIQAARSAVSLGPSPSRSRCVVLDDEAGILLPSPRKQTREA